MSTSPTAGEQITAEVRPGRAWRREPWYAGSRWQGRSPVSWATCTGTPSPISGFRNRFWNELYEQKQIDYHPVFPGRPGYGARRIDRNADVHDVIELLRLNYDRIVARHGTPVEA